MINYNSGLDLLYFGPVQVIDLSLNALDDF